MTVVAANYTFLHHLIHRWQQIYPWKVAIIFSKINLNTKKKNLFLIRKGNTHKEFQTQLHPPSGDFLYFRCWFWCRSVPSIWWSISLYLYNPDLISLKDPQSHCIVEYKSSTHCVRSSIRYSCLLHIYPLPLQWVSLLWTEQKHTMLLFFCMNYHAGSAIPNNNRIIWRSVPGPMVAIFGKGVFYSCCNLMVRCVFMWCK